MDYLKFKLSINRIFPNYQTDLAWKSQHSYQLPGTSYLSGGKSVKLTFFSVERCGIRSNTSDYIDSLYSRGFIDCE